MWVYKQVKVKKGYHIYICATMLRLMSHKHLLVLGDFKCRVIHTILKIFNHAVTSVFTSNCITLSSDIQFCNSYMRLHSWQIITSKFSKDPTSNLATHQRCIIPADHIRLHSKHSWNWIKKRTSLLHNLEIATPRSEGQPVTHRSEKNKGSGMKKAATNRKWTW